MNEPREKSGRGKGYEPGFLAEVERLYPGVEIKVHSARRVYIRIERDRAHDLSRYLFETKHCRLSIATGIDTRDGIEVIYHFSDDGAGTYYNVKTVAPKDDLKLKSLTDFLPAADWIEREIHELLGVDFSGHPNLAPLLTPENWPETANPLRRDFENPEEKA